MISEEAVKERLRFVKHKGQAIFMIDFSQCPAKEMLLAARSSARSILRDTRRGRC